MSDPFGISVLYFSLSEQTSETLARNLSLEKNTWYLRRTITITMITVDTMIVYGGVVVGG